MPKNVSVVVGSSTLDSFKPSLTYMWIIVGMLTGQANGFKNTGQRPNLTWI